jgi:plastocyanin
MKTPIQRMRILIAAMAAIAALPVSGGAAADVTPGGSIAVHLTIPSGRKTAAHNTPAAIWLTPVEAHSNASSGAGKADARPRGPYTLLQKNRMFSPHVLIVPVGSVVHFPNQDPFFHNVFSLFDGKRFDLGLYEAGTTKDVTFSREGLSYIFCNIHPEMSAVVIALSTPFYASGDAPGALEIRGVPPGEYDLHLWVEGQGKFAPGAPEQRVVIHGGSEREEVQIAVEPTSAKPHTNEFGQPYSQPAGSVY